MFGKNRPVGETAFFKRFGRTREERQSALDLAAALHDIYGCKIRVFNEHGDGDLMVYAITKTKRQRKFCMSQEMEVYDNEHQA